MALLDRFKLNSKKFPVTLSSMRVIPCHALSASIIKPDDEAGCAQYIPAHRVMSV